MKTRLLVLVLTVCMIATPAMADLFGFTISNLSTTFTSGTGSFSSVHWSQTTGDLYRNVPTIGTASFDAGWWSTSPPTPGKDGAFSLQMTITSIGATTADGAGSFDFYDTDGDKLSANLTGTWLNVSGYPFFIGTLDTVTYTDNVNTTFDGHSGDSVSMVFAGSSQPWNGAIFQLSTKGTWFQLGDHTNVKGGSIDTSIVPVPAAVLLGILGLGVVGLKLRKYA